MRHTVNYNKLTKLKRMDPSWISITNQKGILCHENVTNFEIILNPIGYMQGLYSIVLG